MIRVQEETFRPGALLDGFLTGDAATGAVATFTGTVRGDDGLTAMTLEHYPGMTEKQLAAIEAEARHRWPLLDVLIVHRFGRMTAGAPIVFVATASAHRAAAFAACEFLMDWLKTKAPFWKMEERPDGTTWVAAQDGDHDRADRWEAPRLEAPRLEE